jgi:hypothetical protein
MAGEAYDARDEGPNRKFRIMQLSVEFDVYILIVHRDYTSS